MNIRAFRKRERRCMRKLIKVGAFAPEDFTPSDGDEAIYAPTDLDERHSHHGFINYGKLTGVPIVWITTGYYEPETDAHLPSRLLAQWRFENETDWEAIWKAEQSALVRAGEGGEE